jgi:hypothetical protein
MVAGFRLHEAMPPVRVIVARHRAPESGKKVSVGKCIGEWVYEVFITTLPTDGFLVEDVLNLYHGRGAFEVVLADLRCRRRSGSLGFLHAVRTRTLANYVWVGVESAASAWARDANGHDTPDRVGCRQRSSFCFRSSGKHTRRVRPVAMGKTVWRSNGTLRGAVLYSARPCDAPLPSRSKSVAKRSARVKMP